MNYNEKIQNHIPFTFDIDQRTGAVIGAIKGDLDGPRIIKVRVVQECSFLEVYWNEYVDELAAIDPVNFNLINGGRRIRLQAKPRKGETDTIFFDQSNKETAARYGSSVKGVVRPSGNCMRGLDPNLHLSSIALLDSVDPTQPISLGVNGTAIADKTGRTALNAVYRNVPVLSFYTKHLMSQSGIDIKSDDTVSEETLRMARDQIDIELGKPGTGIAEAMVKAHNSFAVYGIHENVYLLPEERHNFSVDMYDVEGLGGVATKDGWIASISEKNVRRIVDSDDPLENTRYPNENILIHEFGHSILSGGLQQMEDPTLRDTFFHAYVHARTNGLWSHMYAFQDSDEFFATMATVWFDVAAESADGRNDGIRSSLNWREELRQYDPITYEAMSRILPDAKLPSPWDRPAPNDYGPELATIDKPVFIARVSTANDFEHDVFQITADRFKRYGDIYYLHTAYTGRGGGLELAPLWGSFNGTADTSSAWNITVNDNGTYSFATVPGGSWSLLGLTAEPNGAVAIEGHPANASDLAQQWRFVRDEQADNPYDGFLINVDAGKALSTPKQPYGCCMLCVKDPKAADTMTWRLRNLTQSRLVETETGEPDLYVLP